MKNNNLISSPKVNTLDEAIRLIYFKENMEINPEDIRSNSMINIMYTEAISKFIPVDKEKKMFEKFDCIIGNQITESEKKKWDKLSLKLTKAKENYEKVLKFYKKFIILEIFEAKFTGLITLVFLFFSGLSILFHFKIIAYYEPLAEIGHLICEGYCLLLVLISLSISYFKYKSDSFRLMAKYLKQCWNEIHAKMNYDIDIKNPDYYLRLVNDFKFWLESDITTLTDLGIEAFGTTRIERYTRKNLYKNWYAVRKDIFTFICNKDNVPIGFICLLPLNTGRNMQGRKHYEKKINQFEIKNEMISKAKSELIFLQGIYIQPKYTTEISALLSCVIAFYDKASKFTEDDENIFSSTMIYAEPLTDENNSMLKTLGFRDYGFKSKSNTPILELKFDDPHNKYAEESIYRIKEFKALKQQS